MAGINDCEMEQKVRVNKKMQDDSRVGGVRAHRFLAGEH